MARIAGVLLHLLVAAAVAAVPPCPSQLAVKPSVVVPKVAQPGGQASLETRIYNNGATAVTRLGLRLDLPVGVLPSSKRSTKGVTIVPDGGASHVYWLNLAIKPGRRRVLKLRAHICATAPPGQYNVTGAIYVANATNDVTCLTPLATSIPVCIWALTSLACCCCCCCCCCWMLAAAAGC